MLISYSLKNFRSFKDEKVLNMVCTNSVVKKRYSDNYVSINGADILKTAVIVGENAGGKTNLLISWLYLKDYVFSSTDKIIVSSRNTCFFHKEKTPIEKNISPDERRAQEFKIEILGSDNCFYNYIVNFDNFGIIEESLTKRTAYKSKGKNVFKVNRIEFEKNKKGFKIGYKINLSHKYDRLQSVFDNDSEIDKRGLFLNAFSLIGIQEATVFLNWINENLTVSAERIPLDLCYMFRADVRLNDIVNILKKDEFLEIFKLVDSSITKIKVDETKPFEDTMVYRLFDGEKVGIKISAESSGVKQFFALSYEVYRVIYQGKTMFADECDSFLNPILTGKLFNHINSFEKTGQFIITTHNITHLNFQYFMKEQMVVVTKDKETLESDMYSLCAFKDLRYDSNQKIYDFYLKGLLGGVGNE